ncbi:DUF6625 family protein [Pseudomonas moorei]|uniref:Glycosyl transferase n=1 Tax=Pseudomonas moorei TaxID=395599 RepID=A0A1H1J8R4_9PSED|nr:DUF6625 family protein [Pseudomonas moorei]KAB0505751.1 hypothetical protein F7R06_11785 [Pseudomonas moorei]SDR46180.1 hypothetical protein SAMN04490195_5981 [Pseudomonas moorei]
MINPCPRILFLMPYFGRWPSWMPFFLESCRRNPDIDWLFFSDCGIPENLPPNVTVENMMLSDYCGIVSERLGIDFAPKQAYKLCDIRPAFGLIHADRLQGYDFWGYGDIDLVYGDLRSYFTADRLASYDLFSTHERRVAGHLCLIRNTALKRELFRQIKDWKARFEDQKHHALDEGAFSRIFLWRKNFPKPLFNLVGKFNPLRRRSEFTEAFSTPGGCIKWHDGTENFPRKWYWRDGCVSNDRDGDRRFPYFHFVCWKRNEWSSLPEPDPAEVKRLAAESAWVIDATGFHRGEL